jgi:Kef-type K+ transport system membrane component KefB
MLPLPKAWPMSTMSFTGLLIVSAVAVAAPILATSVRRVKLPSVVVEIVAGTTVGPSVLAWVKIDQPINVVALLGLAYHAGHHLPRARRPRP